MNISSITAILAPKNKRISLRGRLLHEYPRRVTIVVVVIICNCVVIVIAKWQLIQKLL